MTKLHAGVHISNKEVAVQPKFAIRQFKIHYQPRPIFSKIFLSMPLINIKAKHINSMFIIDKFYVVTTTILFRSGELHRSASDVYQFKPKRTQSHSSMMEGA